MLTFVTAFFLTDSMVRTSAEYLVQFSKLAHTGIPILLYLDARLRDSPEEATIKTYPNVTIVEYMTLDTSWIPENVVLPAHRTPQKDTAQYMAIQLQKLPLVVKASEHCTSEYLAWIDFGIFHMVTDVAKVQRDLQTIAGTIDKFPTFKIITPGCRRYAPMHPFNDLCWCFCGSFLVGHRDLFAPAAQRQKELVQRHLPQLTWEINYWYLMRDVFEIYFADHDDSIVALATPTQLGLLSDVDILQQYSGSDSATLLKILASLESFPSMGDIVLIAPTSNIAHGVIHKCRQLCIAPIIHVYGSTTSLDIVGYSNLFIHIGDESPEHIGFLYFGDQSRQSFITKVVDLGTVITQTPLAFDTGIWSCHPSQTWYLKDYGRSALIAIAQQHPDSEMIQVLLEHFEHFVGLYHTLNGQFLRGCGSYLFDGQQYKYQRETLKKQEALYQVGKTASKVLEVGVYLGHSLLLLLLSNPLLTIDCLDIDETFSPRAVAYLNEHFSNRVRFHLGAAKDVLPRLTEKYDYIHIDADHNIVAVREQFSLARLLAKEGAYFVFDDYEAVRPCIDGWIADGTLTHITTPWCLWTNIVTKLNS